jgi:predicted O-linked N-acetylglucosamine transferase (SPINDLY family)
MRIINDRNLEIISRIYTAQNIHYDSFETLVAAVPQALTYYYAYHNRSNAMLFSNINAFYRRLCPSLNYVAPWLTNEGKPKNDADKWYPGCGRKFRVAFISKYLATAHSVLRDRSGIILNIFHKYKDSVDIRYYIFDQPDSLGVNMANQISSHVILPKEISKQREILGEAQLDALVFCEIGMDVFTYFLSFGRYAPLQVDTWGHSDTSGQSTIDYYFSSKWYDTDDSFQNHYSEKLIRMNSLCTFYHDPLDWVGPSYRWKTREEYGFSKLNRIYYCCQSIFKLSPDFDRVLTEILFRDPYSIILIVDSYGLKDELIRTRWEQKFGVNMSRVHFLNKMPFAEFLNYIRISDILLDSYPFGGCNSSLEAFRHNKIVIAMPGDMLNGRFTMGFYNKMGITEPLAANLDEFIEKALYYGTNIEARNELENKIKEMYSVLFYEQDSIHEWKSELERCYSERFA